MAYREQEFRIYCRWCESAAAQVCRRCRDAVCRDHAGSALLCTPCLDGARARLNSDKDTRSSTKGHALAIAKTLTAANPSCNLCKNEMDLWQDVVVGPQTQYELAWVCERCSSAFPVAMAGEPIPR